MRNALLLSTCIFLLSACGGSDDYWGGNSGNDGYNGGYGGGYNNNGGYYPYGNANYPRDRIYIVNGYNPCNGYIYQGYCYRDKDDYRAAVIWDQNHRNDANWNRKRKDWCNHHDCRRDHDTHDRDDRYDRGTTDAKGRPLEQPVERDRAERVNPQQIHPEQYRPQQAPRQHEGRNSQPAKEDRSSSRPSSSYGSAAPRPVRDEPTTQRQQRAEPVQRSQPARTDNGEKNRTQRRYGAKSADSNATAE